MVITKQTYQRFIHLFIGTEDTPLDKRVFYGLLSITTIGLYIAGFSTILFKAITPLAIAAIAIASFYLLILYVARVKKWYSSAVFAFILISSLGSSLQWFNAGGIRGGVLLPLFMINLFFYITILSYRFHLYIHFWVLFNFLVMIQVEAYFPDWNTIDSSPIDSILWSIRATLALSLIAFISSLTKHQYNQARKALEEKNKELQHANKAKSQFLANMSHEIRTPMNGVIGMTDLLGDTPLNMEQKDFLDAIKISGERLLAIINEILDFSKIEAGEVKLIETPFSIRNCIEEVLELNSPIAQSKYLELVYWVDPNVPLNILADEGKLRQVLINLVGNAIKFTSSGEIMVTVKKIAEGTDSIDLIFCVRDTGIGIAAEDQTNLFESFTQVDNTNKRKFGGTGLGLAISKRLIDLMGGQIWVESELDKGSSFFFTMTANSIFVEQEKEIHASSNSSLKDKRILVVDDNETNRWVLEKQLNGWGAIPYLATSAQEALEILEKQSVDAAIVDYYMPDINGLELSEMIVSKDFQFPLLMLSSGNIPDYRDFNKRFDSFIRKPVKQTILFNALVHTFNKKPPQKITTPAYNKEVLPKLLASQIPISILVVEDDFINQKVTGKVLSRMGYQYDLANNGLEAIQLINQNNYNLVFMDIQMPEMDGFEATTHIRQELKKDLLIIAMTANALKEDRQKCLDAGMDDYISKPVIANDIEQVIRQWRNQLLQ